MRLAMKHTRHSWLSRSVRNPHRFRGRCSRQSLRRAAFSGSFGSLEPGKAIFTWQRAYSRYSPNPPSRVRVRVRRKPQRIPPRPRRQSHVLANVIHSRRSNLRRSDNRAEQRDSRHATRKDRAAPLSRFSENGIRSRAMRFAEVEIPRKCKRGRPQAGHTCTDAPVSNKRAPFPPDSRRPFVWRARVMP